MLEKSTSHKAVALSRLIETLERSLTMQATIGAFADEIQELENALWQILETDTIDNGSGDQLDVIGKLVGWPRSGMSDTQFRSFLRAAIKANRASGTLAQIVDVFSELVGLFPGATVHVSESFPAHIHVEFAGELDTDLIPYLSKMLKRARLAGVGSDVYGWVAPSADTFSFFDCPDGLGFGDATDPDVGGEFSTLVSS